MHVHFCGRHAPKLYHSLGPVLCHCYVERENQEKHFPMSAGGQRGKHRIGGHDSCLYTLNDGEGSRPIDFIGCLALSKSYLGR
jgi:hypothetical protein